MKVDLTVLAIPAYVGAMGAEYAWQRRAPGPGRHPRRRLPDRRHPRQPVDGAGQPGRAVRHQAAARPRHTGRRTLGEVARRRRCGRRPGHHVGDVVAKRMREGGLPEAGDGASAACGGAGRARRASVRPAPPKPTPGRAPDPTPQSATQGARRPRGQRGHLDGADRGDDVGRADERQAALRPQPARPRHRQGGRGGRRSWAGTSSTTGTTAPATRAAGCGRSTWPTTPVSATTSPPPCGSRSPRGSR